MAKKPIINRELAENARHMVEFGFWKYLERFMKEIAIEATDDLDQIPTSKMNEIDIGYARGVRMTVKRILDEVQQHTI